MSKVKYHYFHRFFTYSVRRGASVSSAHASSAKAGDSDFSGRPAPKTLSGGEFDWGGTSVKW